MKPVIGPPIGVEPIRITVVSAIKRARIAESERCCKITPDEDISAVIATPSGTASTKARAGSVV